MKPDHGVGASMTYKIMNAEQLESVYMQTKDHVMILEQYIDGDVFTLDGICDENGDIRYLNSLEYVGNCMDSVLYQQSIDASQHSKSVMNVVILFNERFMLLKSRIVSFIANSSD